MTKLQVPLNVDSPKLLRRLLEAVVGRLEEDKTSSDTTLLELQSNQSSLVTDLAATTVKASQTDQNVYQAAELGSLYKDFDSPAWAGLKGNFSFTTLGSETSNPPVTLTGATTYIVYAHCVRTKTGVVHKVMIENTGTDLRVFYRTGSTFTLAMTNGWTQL